MCAHPRRAGSFGRRDHRNELRVVAAVVGHFRGHDDLIDSRDGLRVVRLHEATRHPHEPTVRIGDIGQLPGTTVLRIGLRFASRQPSPGRGFDLGAAGELRLIGPLRRVGFQLVQQRPDPGPTARNRSVPRAAHHPEPHPAVRLLPRPPSPHHPRSPWRAVPRCGSLHATHSPPYGCRQPPPVPPSPSPPERTSEGPDRTTRRARPDAWPGNERSSRDREAGSPRSLETRHPRVQRRSITRLERSPTQYAYTSNATIIDGSYAAPPRPSARYAATNADTSSSPTTSNTNHAK